MDKKLFYGGIACVICLLFCIAAPSLAQQGQQYQQYEPSPELDVADQELEQAAEAYAHVIEIQQDFQQTVQDDISQEKRQKLQNEANEKMIQSVKQSGLDLDRYNEIMQAMGNDAELRERFTAKVAQKQKN